MQVNFAAINVRKCSSCGKDHATLEVEYISPPTKVGDTEYTMATVCPNTGDVIYIRMSAWVSRTKRPEKR